MYVSQIPFLLQSGHYDCAGRVSWNISGLSGYFEVPAAQNQPKIMDWSRYSPEFTPIFMGSTGILGFSVLDFQSRIWERFYLRKLDQPYGAQRIFVTMKWTGMPGSNVCLFWRVSILLINLIIITVHGSWTPILYYTKAMSGSGLGMGLLRCNQTLGGRFARRDMSYEECIKLLKIWLCPTVGYVPTRRF